MRLKTFTAPSMPAAMKLIRDQLGDDAIIVSSQEDDSGVRVTAAMEQPDETAWHDAVDEAPAPDIDLGDLLTERLEEHGCPGRVAERLIRAASGVTVEDPIMALAGALDSVFQFQPLAERGGNRPVMLVGPPGVGKTLTAAKLATRLVMAKRGVSVASTDVVKAGGVAQLESLMRLLKLPLARAETAAELSRAVAGSEGRGTTIVDTAGTNPFARGEMDELAGLIKAAGAEPVLVLAAGGDPFEAAEMAEAFGGLGARRLIVTRVDMARRLGFMLSAAHRGELSFSHVSISAAVADGFAAINPVSLARLLLPDYASNERSNSGDRAFA